MKTKLVLMACLIIGPLASPQPSLAQDSFSPQYRITERLLHSRIWESLEVIPLPSGEWRTNSHSYEELATGMCYRTETGDFADADPAFQIAPEGHAIALRCQHRLIVAADLADPAGVLDCQLPDGRRFRTTFLGLNLFCPVTGSSLQIAAARSCTGTLTAPNEITFFNALEGMLSGDVRIRNERDRFHHDLLLTERFSAQQLEKLQKLGFDPATMRLEAWSQVLESPPPGLQTTVVRSESNPLLRARMVEPDTIDTEVDLGSMRCGTGQSFIEGEETGSAPVFKQWLGEENEHFLVEACAYADLAPLLEKLPASTMTVLKAGPMKGRLLANRSTPRPAGHLPGRRSQIARLDPSRPRPARAQVTIDFTVLNGTLTNLLCQGDRTYFVSGPVTVVNTLTLEGNAILKMTNTTTASISASNVVCLTGPYSPVWITSKDLNGLGENITGSTGNPSGYYGGTALDLSGGTSSQILTNVNFSYLSNALTGTDITLRDVQISNCKNAFGPCGSAVRATVQNALAYRLNSFVAAANCESLQAEHLTAHFVTNFLADLVSTANYTNCLFVCVTNWQAQSGATNSSAFLNSDTGVFQAVGSSLHYLPSDSPFVNAGLTSLTPSLAAGLREKTVFGPVLLTNNITSDLTLSPCVQRDTDLPDLGYHPCCLDYVAASRSVTARLKLVNGVAVGTYGTAGTYAFNLSGQGELISEASATRLNAVVRYTAAQELTSTNWSSTTVGGGVQISSDSAKAQFRFTHFSSPGGVGEHVYGYAAAAWPTFTHCQFAGGRLTLDPASTGMTNCLWHRVYLTLDDAAEITQWWLFNNLFFGGTLKYQIKSDPDSFGLAYDNLFDRTTIAKNHGDYIYGGFNGFVTNYSQLGTNRIVLTNSPVYVAGALGRFYYPTDDGMLSTLIDTGSRSCTNAGLCHFTVKAVANSKEATESNPAPVDPGFHFVATDSSGNPLDSDADGTPDYLEDYDGDWQVDSGETDWQDAADPGLKVWITRPRANSPLP